MDERSAAYERRRHAVQKAMETDGISVLVAYGLSSYCASGATGHGNIRYLTDWTSRFGPSVMIQPVRGLPTLIVPGGNNDGKYVEDSFPWVERGLVETPVNYGKLVAQLLAQSGHRVVGSIGEADWPWRFHHEVTGHKEWQVKPADQLIDTLRLTRDNYEIACHRRASKISDEMLSTLVETLRHHRGPAWKLAVEMEHTGRGLGAELATCWLALGQPVGRSRFRLEEWEEPVRDGDQVLVGTYATYRGYWSHCLRMGSVGSPSDAYRQIYDAAREQHQGAISEMRVGGDAHRIQTRALALAGKLLPNGGNHPALGRQGHFMGLDYAEKPTPAAFPQPTFWSQFPTAPPPGVPLRPNMILEVHTNLGQDGVGVGFIGDLYLVRETGPERLTQFPQDLFIV